MTDSDGAPAQENPAPRFTCRSRRSHGPVWRLGHAGRVLRHHRRAHGGAHRRRAVRRLAHGRGRDRRQGRARSGPAHHLERRLEAAGRADPVLRPDDARRDVRRRPAGLSLRPVALPAGHQRRQHRQGLRLDRRARQGSGAGRRHRQFERSLRADRHPGAEGAGDPADADGDRSAGDQVLLVRARRDRRRPRHRVAHRLHRRRRLRSDGAAGHGARACGTRCCKRGSRTA